MFYMYEDLIKCTSSGQFLQIAFTTSIILYLFWNFEEMLNSMERDNKAIRDRYTARQSTINVSNVDLSSPSFIR